MYVYMHTHTNTHTHINMYIDICIEYLLVFSPFYSHVSCEDCISFRYMKHSHETDIKRGQTIQFSFYSVLQDLSTLRKKSYNYLFISL